MESYHFEPVGAITPIAIGEKHDETTKECHSTVLGDLSFMNPKLCDGLEGTDLAVSDLVTYQNNLQLFDKKHINAVWKSSENHQIDLPIIFWSWLRIYTNQPEKLFNEIKEKFPFIDAFHDNNSQVIINGSDDYIVCTDIMECTYQLGERTYFELGFFRAPSLLCLRDNNYDNMKLKELKETSSKILIGVPENFLIVKLLPFLETSEP